VPSRPRNSGAGVATAPTIDDVADTLLAAFALVLVLEGLLPLAAPRVWRDTFRKLIELTDGQLRFVGLASIAIGLLAWALLVG
jgi:uncharacterized protein YjeT (DUF2065 family)